MQYYCKRCGLQFSEDEITTEDENGNDLCPACNKALDDSDIDE